ncbi:MAG: hypothetical protein J0I62_05440 [Microbacterium sp.]|nr:hypothetical protein [Microbacterium sp.]
MPALLSRALVVGASAVLLVSVAACAPDRPTSTPVPTGSSSPRGDATASDAPVASPSASAQPGITAQSLGGYALGSPLTAAARSLGAEVAGASCPWAFTARSAWETWLLADPDAANPTDTIALIAIDSSGLAVAPTGAPKTASGIGLGSTEAAVRAAYPTAVGVDAVDVDFALRYTEGDGSIVFEGRDGVVQAIKVLPASAENPSEYCG